MVLHDAFAFKGSGERLVETLCRGLDLDLAYGHWSPNSFNLDHLQGRIINLKAASSLLVWRTIKRSRAFRVRTGFLKAMIPLFTVAKMRLSQLPAIQKV
jgi:hypothetical protein